MGTLLNRRRYMGGGGSQDVFVTDINGVVYKVVNYIATPSSGTLPYIDTGFKANQDTSLEIKMKFLELPANGWKSIFGAEIPRFSFIRNTSSAHRWDYNTTLTYLGSSQIHFVKNEPVTILVDKNNFYVDGVQKAQVQYPSTTFTTPYNVALFGNMRSTIGYQMPDLAVLFCKIKDNGVLIRDYIPVSRVSDGEYGLFDKQNLIYYVSPNGEHFIGG